MTSDRRPLRCVSGPTPLNAESTADRESGTAPLVDTFAGRWWVLHTRARNEKMVAAHLTRRSIQYFLPLVRHRRIYGSTVQHVSIPLFPGYVFLCGSSDDRLSALQTNRVANVLDVGDQEQLKHDLRQIERIVQSDEPVDLFPRIKTGTRCRVIAGSLKGLEGVILRRRGPWRVYVAVHFIGQSAELEIDSAMLEAID